MSTSLSFQQLNKMDTDQIQGGGGMAIVVSQCSFDSKSCNDSNTNLTGNYIISNSIFHNNNHSRAANSDMWSFSYGGGLNIFLRWGANGNTFKITNSTFRNNMLQLVEEVWDCPYVTQLLII